jgi:hypothetical protein
MAAASNKFTFLLTHRPAASLMSSLRLYRSLATMPASVSKTDGCHHRSMRYFESWRRVLRPADSTAARSPFLDAVGATTVEKGLGCLALFGHLIVYGRAGGMPEPLNLFGLFEKAAKVSGFTLYAIAPVPDLMRKGIEGSLSLIAEGKLKLLVGRNSRWLKPPRPSLHGVAPVSRQVSAESVELGLRDTS